MARFMREWDIVEWPEKHWNGMQGTVIDDAGDLLYGFEYAGYHWVLNFQKKPRGGHVGWLFVLDSSQRITVDRLVAQTIDTH